MSKINLNRNSDDQAISIEDDLIISVYEKSSITNVEYLNEEDGLIKVIAVSDTMTNIGNASENLISTVVVPSTQEADSGTADGTTAYKLVDAGQNFVTTVTVGMRVKNTTDGTYATVLAVDSNTTLSLNKDIFVSTDTYIIYSLTGSTVWINKNRVGTIDEKDERAVLGMDVGGQSLRRLLLNQSKTVVQTAMVTKSGNASYTVDSYTAAPNTILLAASVGDIASRFTAGDVFSVYGEGTANDGLYSVVSAAWDGTNTVITVTETPTAATAHGGLIEYNVEEGDFVSLITDQTIDGTKTFLDAPIFTPGTGITAFATGGQASATALTQRFSNVTTCATAGDSVKLPTAVAGMEMTVKNSGAAALDVFPNTSDAIDALAVDLAKSVPVGATVVFRAIDATTWESNLDTLGLSAPTTESGTLVLKAADSAGDTETTITNASQAAARTYTIPDAGASANFLMTEGAQAVNGVQTFALPTVYTPETGITAFATGGQGSATQLTQRFNNITTCATAGDSVKLPTAVAGLEIFVHNAGATAVDVFPFSGDKIEGGVSNTAIRLAVGNMMAFKCIDASDWKTTLSGVGDVGNPSVPVGATNLGFYQVSTSQIGASIEGVLTSVMDSTGISADSFRARVEPITAGTNVTSVSYGDGKNFTTELTLTAVSYTIAGAAAEAVGALIATFPAGSHVHTTTSANLALTGGGTVDADTPDVGLGSVIATGAVSVLGGSPTFEDYVTGNTWTATCNGTPQDIDPVGATAGILTGISLNAAADVKTLHLNIADTWAGADTLLVSGTVYINWSIMSA